MLGVSVKWLFECCIRPFGSYDAPTGLRKRSSASYTPLLRTTAALVLLPLIVSACSFLQPRYERPAAPIPSAYPELVDQTDAQSMNASEKEREKDIQQKGGPVAESITTPSIAGTEKDKPHSIQSSNGSALQLGSVGTVGSEEEKAPKKGDPVLDSQDPIAGDPVLDAGWRTYLGDARLQAIVGLALENNRDARAAALKVESLQAQYRIQRAGLLPRIQMQGQMARSRTPASLSPLNHPTVGNQFFVGPQAAWEIDLFGKLASLKNTALAQYLASRFTSRAIHMALIAQVADQYLLLRASEAQLDVTRNALATAKKLYALTKLQYRVGTGSELDMQSAIGAQEQANANYQNQLRLRAQAENALALLVGQPLPADLPPALPFANQKIIANIPAGLPSELLVRRPDILAAEANLRAANANIGAARATFFPSITLTGQYGSASPQLGQLFKAGNTSWSFGSQALLPIFNAGANLASLRVAKVQKEIAIAQYEKTIQTAFREVADGLVARGTYDQQLLALERYARAVQRRLDLSILRYRNGIESYLGVLTAQTELYQVQQTLISTRLARLVNLVDLYQYLGGPTALTAQAQGKQEAALATASR